MGAVGSGADHLLRLGGIDAPDPGGERHVREAHRHGLYTVLWCYLRNDAFKKDGVNYRGLGRPDRPGEPISA